MMYHSITKDDMKNGSGLRVVLWLAGCEHHCPGCHNPQTWDADRGIPFTCWDEAGLFELLGKKHISGITFSGGDPLHPANRDSVGRIAQAVSRMENKNVWLYTGYTLAEKNGRFVFLDEHAGLPPLKISWLGCIDILVDGRYVEEIRQQDLFNNADPDWRGSSNQRLIDVRQSLGTGKIVEANI